MSMIIDLPQQDTGSRTAASDSAAQTVLGAEPSQLTVTSLKKSYGSRTVVKDVSLAVKSGK